MNMIGDNRRRKGKTPPKTDAVLRRRPIPKFNVVVLAASAGGIEVLSCVLSSLPADFPVPIAVVQHRTAQLPNYLPQILGRKTALRVKMVEEGERLQAGTVYLAPADKHLFIKKDRTVAFSDGLKIRHVLSSANPLFTSAAHVFKKGVIAVVLTGGDSDATDGVQSVKAAGGIVIAQDPLTCQAFGMPESAIATGSVHYILPLEEIGPKLRRMMKEKKTSEGRSPWTG